MPFQWDGSHLGTLTPKNIFREESIWVGEKTRCWQIEWSGEEEVILVKSIRNKLPAILDQFKPVLQLPSMGCQTFRYQGKLMIAYRPLVWEGYLYNEINLQEYNGEITENLRQQIKRNLAFREVFGITRTFERSLLLRYDQPEDSDQSPKVISYLESGCIDNLKSTLSQRLLTQWFSEHRPKEILTETIYQLFLLDPENPEVSLAYYREKFDEIVNRIDPTLIGWVDTFFDRLNLFLPY